MAHFCFSYRGPLSSEEFVPLVKGFTFIYIEKRREEKAPFLHPFEQPLWGKKIDIPDRLRPSTGYLQLIGMPTWHIGPLGSEEFDHKLKGFTFIYIEIIHIAINIEYLLLVYVPKKLFVLSRIFLYISDKDFTLKQG